MPKKVVLTFSEEEIQELERLDLDSDAPGALAYLREVIGKKLKALNRPHCVPVFEVTYSPRQKEAFQSAGPSREKP
jgi:hypothetical protein